MRLLLGERTRRHPRRRASRDRALRRHFPKVQNLSAWGVIPQKCLPILFSGLGVSKNSLSKKPHTVRQLLIPVGVGPALRRIVRTDRKKNFFQCQQMHPRRPVYDPWGHDRTEALKGRALCSLEIGVAAVVGSELASCLWEDNGSTPSEKSQILRKARLLANW